MVHVKIWICASNCHSSFAYYRCVFRSNPDIFIRWIQKSSLWHPSRPWGGARFPNFRFKFLWYYDALWVFLFRLWICSRVLICVRIYRKYDLYVLCASVRVINRNQNDDWVHAQIFACKRRYTFIIFFIHMQYFICWLVFLFQMSILTSWCAVGSK